MAFKIATDDQSKIHFDFTNNYLVVPAWVTWYRKPYLTTLKAVFYNLSSDPRIPDGMDLLQEYELTYVGAYKEHRITNDNDNAQIETEELPGYGSTLNPVIPGISSFKRLKFLDSSIVLTNPDNLTFDIKLVEVNRKVNPLYRWDSRNSNLEEWCQPPPAPPYLQTADTMAPMFFGPWKHFDLAFKSTTFPAKITVTVEGFLHPENFQFNGKHECIAYMFNSSYYTLGRDSWYLPDVFPFNVYYINHSVESSTTQILFVNHAIAWDGSTPVHNLEGTIVPSRATALMRTVIGEIQEEGTVVSYEINEEKLHPLSDIYIEFGDVSKIVYIGFDYNQSKNSTLAGTTVALTYDPEYLRWSSAPLESNGYPFRLQIYDCYNTDLFNNLEPNKDINGYYGSAYDFVSEGETFNYNTFPAYYEPGYSIFNSLHRAPMMLISTPGQLEAITPAGSPILLWSRESRIDQFSNPIAMAPTIEYYAIISFPTIMNLSIDIGQPNAQKVLLTNIKRIYQFNDSPSAILTPAPPNPNPAPDIAPRFTLVFQSPTASHYVDYNAINGYIGSTSLGGTSSTFGFNFSGQLVVRIRGVATRVILREGGSIISMMWSSDQAIQYYNVGVGHTVQLNMIGVVPGSFCFFRLTLTT